MKYQITNLKTKEIEIIEARKKPAVDLEKYSVKRIREVVIKKTNNQVRQEERRSNEKK